MIKKTIILSILVFGFVFAGGLVAKPVLAATSGIAGVELDNTAGTIPITVYVYFYHSGTSSAPGPQYDYRVVNSIPAGASTWQYSSIDTPDSPYYWIRWSTSCSDPPALATYAGTWGSSFDPGGSINAYQTDPQDVHCTTPNATPTITTTACATVGWTLTGVGVDGANIASFSIYESTDPSLLGPGDPQPGTIYVQNLSPGTRSYNFGFNQPNTYYMRIRAVSPQGVGSWSSVGQFTCGAAITPATGLSATPYCPTSGAGNIVAVNYGWVGSSGGSTAQYLDYSIWNNGFAPGTFSSYTLTTTATSYSASTGYPQGVTFYWRVNNQIGGNWYPSVTATFVTPSCPVATVNPASPTPMPTPQVGKPCPAGCTAPTYTLSEPRPNSYWTMWGSACGTYDGSTYSGTTPGLTASVGFLSFCNGQTVYWHVQPVSSAYNAMRGWDIGGQGTITAASDGSASISWSWEYEMRIYLTGYNYGDVGSQSQHHHVTADSSSTFSYTFSGLNSGASYQRVFCAADCVLGAYLDNYGFTSGSCTACPTIAPTPTAVPAVITVSGYSDCVDGVNAKVHLTWTSNTGSTAYTIYRDGTNATSQGLPNPPGSADRSWNSTVGQPGGAHNWMVQGTGGSFDPTNSNTIAITTATCVPPPADPSNLQVATACDAAGNPTLTFTWQNNATTESGFWLDVSHDAFTGPSSTTVNPSVWGVKGIVYSTAGPSAVQFIWDTPPPPVAPALTSNTVGQLDSGDVDSAVAGNQLSPERGVTYYWRVTAFSASQQSNHVYPTSTTTPPGISVTTKMCQFDLAVSNNPAGNTQVYDPGATVSFKVQVTNTTAADIAYPGGGSLGAWTLSNVPAPAPNCPGTVVTPAPNPPTNTVQSIPISTLNVGASTVITLANFTAPTAPGSYIANFYALPNCSPSGDKNWTNNGFQLTYVVAAKTWFQTVNGDLGARGKIQVSNTAPPSPQSSWVMAGNPLDSSVLVTPSRWELNNYTKALFPPDGSGVYQYFNSRFRSKATINDCTLSNGIHICAGGTSIAASSLTGTTNVVMFVDGNLNVTGNITVDPASAATLVFIVSGNVTVNTSVTQADGIYITGGTFADYDNGTGKSRTTSPYMLSIRGAVYARAFDLAAFLSDQPACVAASPSCSNKTTPTDYVYFQPKYLVLLSQMIGSAAVSWQEVAP